LSLTHSSVRSQGRTTDFGPKIMMRFLPVMSASPSAAWDELAMPLQRAQARLQSARHRYDYLRVATFLKRAGDDFALAGDAVLAVGDEPLANASRSVIGPVLLRLSTPAVAGRVLLEPRSRQL
jgi:hypothetical protein